MHKQKEDSAEGTKGKKRVSIILENSNIKLTCTLPVHKDCQGKEASMALRKSTPLTFHPDQRREYDGKLSIHCVCVNGMLTRVRTQEPTVKNVASRAVQTLVDHIKALVEEATLGYGLITVMDETDLGRGPMMKRMEVNLRDIDDEFMEEFIKGVERHGLQNRMLENAMDLGVSKKDIDVTSLIAAQSTPFTNRAVWEPSATKSHSLLYNGNHRFHYMRHKSDWVTPYNNRKRTMELLAEGRSPKLADVYQEAIDKSTRIIDDGGVWLMRFLDMGRWKHNTPNMDLR